MSERILRAELEKRRVALGMDSEFDVLAALLAYDPNTGALTWKRRDARWFTDANTNANARADGWNLRYAGKPALNSKHITGRKCGGVFGVSVLAHRIAWAITHKQWPDNIDHINGDPTDNRICNLRSVPHSDNCKNFPRFKNNRSGTPGVACREGRWRAHITVNYRRIHLGSFGSYLEARAARKRAESEYGFHTNHGRRA